MPRINYDENERESHESKQNEAIESNENRIRVCRETIRNILRRASEYQGNNPVVNYINNLAIESRAQKVGVVSRIANFFDAARAGDFFHEWDQNDKISKASACVEELESVVDEFFVHMQGISRSTVGTVLHGAFSTFANMEMPSDSDAKRIASSMLGIALDLYSTSNHQGDSSREFGQNQNIRSVSSRLDLIERKLEVISKACQNTFIEALNSNQIEVANLVIDLFGHNAVTQRIVNQRLDDGITGGNMFMVMGALRLGAQVNNVFNKDLPLLKAVRAGNFDIVRALVITGQADVNAYSSTSCCDSFLNFFRSLLCMKTKATTLLHIAASSGEHNIAALLYENASQSVRAQIDGAGHTAKDYFANIDQPPALPAMPFPSFAQAAAAYAPYAEAAFAAPSAPPADYQHLPYSGGLQQQLYREPAAEMYRG